MSEPKILAEDENGNRRLVELETIHEIDSAGSLSLLYTASMTMGGVTLRRISSNEPSTQFYLDFNVMNALAAGWTQANSDWEARARAEEQRKQDAVTEAYSIAAQHPEIKIKAGKSYWEVSIPSQGYSFCSPAYYPEVLLNQAKECVAVLIGHEDAAIGGDAA